MIAKSSALENTSSDDNLITGLFSIREVFDLLCLHLSAREITRLLATLKVLNQAQISVLLNKLKYYYLQIGPAPIEMEKSLSALNLSEILTLLRIYQKNIITLADLPFQDVRNLSFFSRGIFAISFVNDTAHKLLLYKLIQQKGFPAQTLRKLSQEEVLCGQDTFEAAVKFIFYSHIDFSTRRDNPILRFFQNCNDYASFHWVSNPSYPVDQFGQRVAVPGPDDYQEKRSQVLEILGDQEFSENEIKNLVKHYASNQDQVALSFITLRYFTNIFKSLNPNFFRHYDKDTTIILNKIGRFIKHPDQNERAIRIQMIGELIRPTLANLTSGFSMVERVRVLLILLSFKDVLTSEQIRKLVILATEVTVLLCNNYRNIPALIHRAPIKRFIDLLKASGNADFDYFQWLKFMFENKLNVTLQWDESIANFFVHSNIMSAYTSCSPSVERREITFDQLKNASLMAGKLNLFQAITYDQWMLVLSCPHLFLSGRAGGVLTFRGMTYDPIRMRYITDDLKERDIPDEYPIDRLKRFLKAFHKFKSDTSLLSIHHFYTAVLPRFSLDDPILMRRDDLGLDIIETDAGIIQLIQYDPEPYQRLQQLLQDNADLVRGLLHFQINQDGKKRKTVSLLRWVLCLPSLAFNELMQFIIAGPFDPLFPHDISRILQFLKENKGLWLILNPKLSLNARDQQMISLHYYYIMILALKEHSIECLNRLSEIIIEPEKQVNAISFVLRICVRHDSRRCEPKNLSYLIGSLLSVIDRCSDNEAFMLRLSSYVNISMPIIKKIIDEYSEAELLEAPMIEESELLEEVQEERSELLPKKRESQASSLSTQLRFTLYGTSGMSAGGQKRAHSSDESDDEEDKSESQRHKKGRFD